MHLQEHKQRGFTLIELLIVITILGILAIAVISTINPVEQINRGHDTATLVTAEQIYTAYGRVESMNAGSTPDAATAVLLSSNEGKTALEYLFKHSELKASFADNPSLQELYLTHNPTDKQISLCFQPNSKAFEASLDISYAVDGTKETDCVTNQCYACLNQETIQTMPVIKSNGVVVVPTPTPSPTPTPAASWYRAPSGNSCKEYCESISLQCSDKPNTCPSYCGNTSGYAQIEATWASLYPNQKRDSVTNETCWASGSCNTSFQYKPLWAFNARCCCG